MLNLLTTNHKIILMQSFIFCTFKSLKMYQIKSALKFLKNTQCRYLNTNYVIRFIEKIPNHLDSNFKSLVLFLYQIGKQKENENDKALCHKALRKKRASLFCIEQMRHAVWLKGN